MFGFFLAKEILEPVLQETSFTPLIKKQFKIFLRLNRDLILRSIDRRDPVRKNATNMSLLEWFLLKTSYRLHLTQALLVFLGW